MSDNKNKRPHGRRSNAPWLAGAAGLTAVGTAAGVSVARSLRRRVSTDDPYDDEDFELLDADRSYVVTTPDGVDLAVREVGPVDARLTVVFAHGFCLRMGAFYFQRARLAEQWGRQVRMVFYDQRGHGQSGEAPPETYTVTQLGQDLETMLAVMAPRGPVVLVGHSMGGMTVVACSVPHRYRPESLGRRSSPLWPTVFRGHRWVRSRRTRRSGGPLRRPVRSQDCASRVAAKSVIADPAGGVLR